KKCVYASMRMGWFAPLSVGSKSVGNENVDQGLLAVANDRIACARERGRKLVELFHPFAVAALRTHEFLEWRARRQVGKELAVVFAGRTVLEHRQRRAPHRAVAAVV